MEILIGKSLEEAIEILEKDKVDYEVAIISGGKDSEILQEMHIVRVREKGNKLELTATGFKTTI